MTKPKYDKEDKPPAQGVPRPKEYDDMVVAYMPFITKMAHRLVPHAEVPDLVQDVMLLACYRYPHYRPEQYKFVTWLWMLVRNAAAYKKGMANAKMRTARHVDIDDVAGLLATPPNQEEATDLSAALNALPKDRDGEIWLRHAQGEELAEIGRTMGIGRERTRQLGDRGRQRMERKLALGAMVRHMKEAA